MKGSPHNITAHTIARLIISFPTNAVKANFHILNLAIPRRIITMSSGGIGVIAAINDEPLLSSIYVNESFPITIPFGIAEEIPITTKAFY